MPYQKENSVEDWIEELDLALEYRRKYGVEDSWRDNEKHFYHLVEGQDKGGPNLIYSTGDTLLSNLTTPYPSVTVTPERFESIPGSRILERVDNKLITQMKMRREVANATINTYLFGKGFLKCGYDSEFGWEPELEIQGSGMTLSQHDKKGNLIEFNSLVQPGMPWVSSVLPHDILVPWGTRNLDSSPWIAHRLLRHVDCIKSDYRYDNTRDLQPNVSSKDFMESYSTVMKPYRVGERVNTRIGTGENEYVELWEIHDRRTGKIFVLSTGYDKFLRNELDALQISGLPFIELGFVPKSRSLWVTPDAYYLRGAQFELTDISVIAAKQRRISVLKFMYQSGAMDESQLDKLFSSTVGAGVEVKGDIDRAVKTFQPMQNPQIYMEAQQVYHNARETSGISSNQMGEYESTGRRSATEAAAVSQGSRAKTDRRSLEVGDVYIETFKIINPFLTNFWKTPRVIDVVGQLGTPMWVGFVGDQLHGQYSYTVNFTQLPPQSQDQRKQQALGIYQTMVQDPTVDPIQLRRYLANAFNDVQFSQIFKPGILEGAPNAAIPLQMQQAQLPLEGAGGHGGGGGATVGLQPQPYQALPGL